jgi:oxygen-independent coproporphyrinogen-3 oxidase
LGYTLYMPAYSIYLHIPFCVHRCAYCDFNTYAGLEGLIPAYTRALQNEIIDCARQADHVLPVHTVFFGGGTPSLLLLEHLQAVLTTLREHFALDETAEVSLEANPGTLSPQYLRGLRESGVNRLSLGVQSANPGELRMLERQHGYSDVIKSVTWARQAGFDNLNLDLIFGLPEQEIHTWQETLKLVCGLQPEHLSLYALTLEHGTPMQHWVAHGLMPEPDADLAADMYDWAGEYLAGMGYEQYEISNWGRRNAMGELLACRHNLQYWRGLPYLGFGAGAHGYASGVRTANVLAPAVYIDRLKPSGESNAGFPRTRSTASSTVISRQDEMGEMMMMGLRLTREGVSATVFEARFGEGLLTIFKLPIERLIQQGLLEWAGDCLRLTPRGRLLGNRVFMEFI